MRKQFEVYRLRFRAPVHLGEVGVGVENVVSMIAHSDTLWAAITHAWARLFGTDPPTTTDPPFRLSSAFPFLGPELYFPKPIGTSFVSDTISPTLWKDFKKAKFIPANIFQSLLNGEKLNEIQVKLIAAGGKQLKSHINDYLHPHVMLGALAMGSNLYYVGATWFDPDADIGLYFLVEFKDPSIKPHFDAVMNYLADEGIGGRRTYGLGQFEPPESETVELELPDDADCFITLSRLIPNPELLKHLQKARYSLYLLKGWAMSSGYAQGFRKPVWMFEEGSIFPTEPIGRIVDVTPVDDSWNAGHKAYRHGLGFYLPMRGGCSDEGD